MNRLKQPAVLAAAVVIAATLGACTTAGGNGTPTATTSPSQSVTTPATPTLSQAELDSAAASAAVVTMWEVIDRLGADPKSDLGELGSVTRDAENTQWTKLLFERRTRGERFIGNTKVTVKSATAGAEGEYRVDACLDVSKLNVVDAQGKSIVPAERKPTIGYSYDVTQDQTSKRWYVISEKVVEAC